ESGCAPAGRREVFIMAWNWFRWRRPSFLPQHSAGGTGRRKRVRLTIEVLEHRCLLATAVWDGVGFDEFGRLQSDGAFWTNRYNWVGDAPPQPGDAVVTPAVAATPHVPCDGPFLINSLVSDEAFGIPGSLTAATVQVNNTFGFRGLLEGATILPG